MIDLTPFFRSPFASRNVSFSHLQTFTHDHLARLEANDPAGSFTARRATTATALAALEQAFTTNDEKLGHRKAYKQTKRAFRKALPAAIGKINVVVKARFGERAVEVTECFPKGRSIFARCADAVLEDHLAGLINGLTAHAAALGSAVVSQAEGLLAGWRAVWETSGSASGEKAAAEAARRGARRGLERELYLNLLALAQTYPLQPEKVALFMQPSLLLPHRHHPEKTSTPVAE